MVEELERVRAYRDDVPEPDAATVAAARARLMAAIASEPQPKARITRNRGRTNTRAQRWRRFALASGLVAAGVAAAGVFGIQANGFTPSRALAREMNQLAKAAASQAPTGTPGRGQYLYTVSYQRNPNAVPTAYRSCVVSYVEEDQMWIAADGSGVLRKSIKDLHFASPQAEAACARHGVTNVDSFAVPGGDLQAGIYRFPAGSLSLQTEGWKSLSTNPATLLKQVHQKDGGPNTPAEWFTNIADFMHETDAPPAILAALYQATALIPGVRALGMRMTADGQTGPAVAFYADGKPTHELIFDQRTGRLLAEAYYNDGVPNWIDVRQEEIVASTPPTN